jgi:hypothetical protein
MPEASRCDAPQDASTKASADAESVSGVRAAARMSMAASRGDRRIRPADTARAVCTMPIAVMTNNDHEKL